MEKNEPELLDEVLSAHFATRFLLDFLQFSFSHLVVAKTEEAERIKIYDGRKQIDLESDGKLVSLRF